MASYFAKLSSLVSGGYTFPYSIGDAYSASWGSWTHFQGAHKETGAAVSVFRVSSGNKDEPKMVAARIGVKRLRTVRQSAIHVEWTAACVQSQYSSISLFSTVCDVLLLLLVQLRHPNILQFKDTAEVEERGETVIYLVTEACTPLADHLQRLDIQVGGGRQ